MDLAAGSQVDQDPDRKLKDKLIIYTSFYIYLDSIKYKDCV